MTAPKKLSTKERILDAALELFNTKGVGGVTMRDISEEAGLSPGNLAYHFKNKNVIVEMLFVQMENERKTALSEVQAIPSFEVINRQSLMIIGLTEKYKFVILDTMSLFRQFPELGKLQSKYAHEHIAYIKAMFDYSVGSGNMIAEQEEGQYERLAKLVWMTLFHWPVQEFITPSEQAWELEVRKAMWDMFKPYLTDKGRENFERALLK